MNPLRVLAALALGLAIPAAGLLNSASPETGAAVRLAGAAMQAAASGRLPWKTGMTEVAVAFDGKGRVSDGRVSRSSGSSSTDAAALDAALELASLRPPAEVAGRTLLFRTSFDSSARAE